MICHPCRVLRLLSTRVLLAVAMIGMASTAHAVLIDNGVTTIDNASGLEWLDLTQTQNRSYADVASGFGSGGEFEGWRHATISELITLQTNAGFAPPYDLQPVTAAFTNLIDLLGRTQDGTGFDNVLDGIGAIGWYDDSGSPTGTSHLRFFELDNGVSIFAQVLAQTPDSRSTTEFNIDTGNWLVRAAVPEPATIVIFGLSVVGLGYARRKRVA